MEQVTPETVGLSSERLGRVSEWLRAQLGDRLAGASVLVGRRGRIALCEAVGLADREIGRDFTPETIVRIFSMSKPVTTVAAMMLYERGAFQLDDPIARYLPEFANPRVWDGQGDASATVPASGPITVRHLMTHTSGLTYGFMHSTPVDALYRERGLEFDRGKNLAAAVSELAEVPLICDPGSQWNYSVSIDVLGRLVEVWSGQDLAGFLSTEIFAPLGMLDTGFHVAPDNHDRFASLYGPQVGGDMSSVGAAGQAPDPSERGGLKLQDAATGSRYLRPADVYSGGGGLTGTIGDYGRFCQMCLNGGELDGVRLLSPKTMRYMRLNQLPDNRDMAAMGQPVWSETSYDGIGFGLGWAVVIDPVKASFVTSPGEHHWGGAASTFFWLDPEEDLFCVFFTQLIPSSTYPIRRELRTRVYQAIVD